MFIGCGIKLLYVLIDQSGSMKGDEDVVKPYTKLIEDHWQDTCLVSINTFGHKNAYICKEVPISKAPTLKNYRTPGGNSPIYDSIYNSIDHIIKTCNKHFITEVRFLLLSDFCDEDDSDKSECDIKARVNEMKAKGWNFSVIMPNNGYKKYALQCGFSEEHIMSLR